MIIRFKHLRQGFKAIGFNGIIVTKAPDEFTFALRHCETKIFLCSAKVLFWAADANLGQMAKGFLQQPMCRIR